MALRSHVQVDTIGHMLLVDQISSVFHLPGRHRRTWSTPGRAHIELREVPAERTADFCAAVEDRLASHPDVAWAEVLTAPGRVVVSHGPNSSVAELVALVEETEVECGVDGYPFGIDRPDHPADPEPVIRAAVAVAADSVGLALALTGRLRRWRPVPIEIDTAALLAVAENVPAIRGPLDRAVTHPVAELGLSIANGIASGLAQGPLGPLVDVAQRVALVTEAEARRRVWERREPELCAKPSEHTTRTLRPPERPAPLREGPVERYADRAWIASVGGFGVGLAATRSLDRATAALVAGLPKAARLGREVFAAQLGRILAGRGVLLVDPGVLRHLDRVDALIIEGELLQPESAGGPPDERAGALLGAARGAGLRVVIAAGNGEPDDDLDADEFIPAGRMLQHVLALQANGSGVAVLATGTEPALEHADCGIGLTRFDKPPWGADLICSDDLADAWLVIHAVGEARLVSQQSATIAMFAAGAATFLTFGGIVPGTARRVGTAINLGAALAMVNGSRVALSIAPLRLPAPRDEIPWHRLDISEVLDLVSSTRQGLPADLVASRTRAPRRPDPVPLVLARNVVDELLNPLTPVLVVGAGLSLAVGSFADAVLVSGVVGLNALIGGVQRFRADRAIEALQRDESQPVLVRRGGAAHLLAPSAVVPGDLLVLEAGDALPADCRILEAKALQVDESSLTGESLPVAKTAEPTDAALVAERSSMLYAGTGVAAGTAEAIVVATGDDTEAERGVLLAEDGPPPSGVEARLSELTNRFLPLSVGAGLGVVGIGLLRGRSMVETAGAGVSLAVAAVPEGLPLLATVAQLGAARRLSARGALVRNPRAIEALGRVDVLCVDKTGTLTEGRLRVSAVSDGHAMRALDDLDADREVVLATAARATPDGNGDRSLPHPTDRAIVYALEAAGVEPATGQPGWSRREELPFEPGRAWHATYATTDTGAVLSVKGAPETLTDRCVAWRSHGGDRLLTDADREHLHRHAATLAGQGLRVLAVAERSWTLDEASSPGDLDDDAVDHLTFIGFLGIRDPIRPTATDAVTGVRRAGVDVVMITGDHPATAAGVAEEVGLGGGKVLTGTDIDCLDDGALAQALTVTTVCARVTPAHKVRIVRSLQHAGRVVAMTGDGSNDAPAIRLAHVGIALGTRATTAARDAADLTVVDDRIETIVDAIAEGRTMWAAVRDAVAVLAGGNLGEIGFTIGGSLISGGPPLNARQLLLVNLLTDVAPALAIALRPPGPQTTDELLREGPDRSLGSALDEAIAARAVTTAVSTGLAWGTARLSGTPTRASTVGLVALVGTQLGQTLATGGRSPAVLAAGIGSAAVMAAVVQTPGLSQLMGCRPLGPVGWTIGLSAAAGGTAASVLLPRLLPDGAFSRLLPWVLPAHHDSAEAPAQSEQDSTAQQLGPVLDLVPAASPT